MIFEANEGVLGFLRQSPKPHNMYYRTQKIYQNENREAEDDLPVSV